MHFKPGHLLKYIQPNGTEINLHSPPSRSVMNMTGWGYIIPDIHSIKGPFQHGSSILGYRFPERNISLDVVKPGCSRSEWFNERSNLITKLGIQNTNSNLPSLGRLQWEYVEDDTIKKRAVDCYLSRGLEFSPDPQWYQTGILESLEFIALDPFVYNPTLTNLTTSSFNDTLILPMVFPFTVGAGTYEFTTNYAGTWTTYPIITITGPTNGFRLINDTTGISIELDYFINSGITVTFDLTIGAKTVTDNLGNNLILYLKNANLAEFEIIGNVNNVLTAYVAEHTAATTVTISYYEKFIGI